MPEIPDPKPDPSKASSPGEPVRVEPDPASAAAPPGPGEPDSTATDDRQKLGELVQRGVQGTMDTSIHQMQTGQFDKMDPKVVELLSTFTELQRPARNVAGVPPSSDSADIFKPPDRTGASDQKPPSDEELGRRTRMERAYKTIQSHVEVEKMADFWLEDVQALFAEIGTDTAIDPKDYEAIDPFDTRRFPRTREGYRKWKAAAQGFRKRYYGPATGEEEEEPSSVDADRVAAGQARKPPVASGTRKGITTLAQAARLNREGKMSDDDYKDKLKEFSKIS